MARIVLPIAGAAIGFYLGGPMGAQVGFALGSIAGGIVDPIKTQGPRLEDLKVQSSSYGAPIPILYGTMRMAGQLIWATDLKEVSKEESAKGGPEVTTYSYYVSCAIGICEGPIAGIRRIWADSKLVYDASNPDLGIVGIAGISDRLRVYLGDETQLPDPTMEAHLGAGKVPAHRGMAYVVFDDLPLESFGNRIPNFTFEVVSASGEATTQPFTKAPYKLAGNHVGAWHIADTDRVLYLDEQNAYLMDAYGNSLDRIDWPVDNPYFYWFSSADGPYIWLATQNYQGYLLDTAAGRIVREINDGYPFDRPVLAGGMLLTGYFDQLILRDRQGGLIRDHDGNPVTTPSGWGLAFPYSRPMMPSATTPESRVLVWNSTTYAWGFAFIGFTALFVTQADWIPLMQSPQSLAYVQHLNQYWIVENGSSDILVIDVDSQSTQRIPASHWPSTIAYVDYSPVTQQVYGDALGSVHIIDPADQTVLRTIISPADLSLIGPYSSDGRSVFGGNKASSDNAGVIRTTMGAIVPGTVTLADVLSDLHARSGLDPSQLDAAAVSDSVAGYAVTNRMPIRAAIEPLRAAYFLDAVESDGKVRYSRRGAAPVASIPYQDLAAHEGGAALPAPLSSTRAQEIDLPATVDVGYLNPATNYEQGNQRARRVTTSSREAVSVSLPIVLSDDQARQIADAMLYTAWAGRTQVRFAVSQQYAQIDPGDVVSVDTPDGPLRLLITSTSYARPGVLSVTAVADDPAIYQQTATGAPAPATTDRIPVITGTRLALLDIPILRDSDDDAGFYAAASGYNAAWPGARLYKSSDSTNYSAVTDLAASIIGSATSVLASGVTTTWDTANSVTVAILTGTLAGDTDLAVLNGANAALLGDEIIQFQSATQNADGTWTLSRLLRGRRGTEWAAGSHRSGERFVLLSGNLRRVAGEYQLSRQYKGVTYGKSLSSASDQAFALQSIGLKPFAPVHLRGSRDASSNLTITWVRRTRVQGDWRDYTDVPIGEASERYEIDILSGTTVKRTLTATSPSVVYAAADQTTDFGSAQASISVKIYQLSDRVGRGYAAAASV